MTSRAPNVTQRGFTLLEVLVVISILGAVMGIAAASIPRRGGTLDLTDAAEGIAGSLRLGRARAIAYGRAVAFVPARDGRSYAVDGVARSMPPATYMDAAPVIGFSPEGGGTGGTIRVASTQRALLVQVEWLTGRVSVTDAP